MTGTGSTTSHRLPAWLERGLLIALGVAFFLGGYFLLGHLTQDRAHPFPFELPFECHLPFYPPAVFAYLLALVLPDFALFGWPLADRVGMRRQALAYALLQTLSFAIYAAYPVHADLRPATIAEPATLSSRVLATYYALDPPVNLFPSLHCGHAVLAALLARKLDRRLGWLVGILALAVLVSVLLVKQHYVADVLAGLGLAWLVDRLVGPVPVRRDAATPQPIERSARVR